MRIPIKYISTYRPTRKRKGKISAVTHGKNLVYGDSPDKEIDVVSWMRWPSYDFIFGVPSKSHSLYGIEAGFFQYRDSRKRNVVCGFYVDENELERLVEGFGRVMERHKRNKSTK